jgi:hypothetical protein
VLPAALISLINALTIALVIFAPFTKSDAPLGAGS